MVYANIIGYDGRKKKKSMKSRINMMKVLQFFNPGQIRWVFLLYRRFINFFSPKFLLYVTGFKEVEIFLSDFVFIYEK